MKESTSTPETRWAKRSLEQQLLFKFTNDYGYERGPIVALAIVTDILALIQERFSDKLPPRHVNWPAVPIRHDTQVKNVDLRTQVNVRLQVVTDEEVALLNDQQLRNQRTARMAFNQHRFVRWCQEAYQQGAVLSLFELSLLSGISEGQIGRLILREEQQSGKTIPVRGTIHDLGGSVTHKAEVIRRYLRQESPADIARELSHSQQAVDIYIKDYLRIRQLAQKFPVAEIHALAKCSQRLVHEYIKLLRTYEPNVKLYSDVKRPDQEKSVDTPEGH